MKRAETLSNMGLMYVLDQYLDYRKQCSISCITISCINFINSRPNLHRLSSSALAFRLHCNRSFIVINQIQRALSFTITNDRQALSWTKRGATIIIFGCAPPGKVFILTQNPQKDKCINIICSPLTRLLVSAPRTFSGKN